MGTNRTQPFGYRMERGKVVIDPDEFRWVVYIYERYIQGASFKQISDTLCCTGIGYDVDKTWNKNMVARILQDRRYIGEREYPQIIDTLTFRRVDEKRDRKKAKNQMSQAQKMLRKKCGQTITPYIEHEVLYLLNTLAGKTDRIQVPRSPGRAIDGLQELQKEFSSLMELFPVDEKQARKKLMEVTVAMYEAIDPREYETQRLKKIFSSVTPQEELDAHLIDQSITAVMVDGMGKVRIRLKNDQIIERGELSE